MSQNHAKGKKLPEILNPIASLTQLKVQCFGSMLPDKTRSISTTKTKAGTQYTVQSRQVQTPYSVVITRTKNFGNSQAGQLQVQSAASVCCCEKLVCVVQPFSSEVNVGRHHACVCFLGPGHVNHALYWHAVLSMQNLIDAWWDMMLAWDDNCVHSNQSLTLSWPSSKVPLHSDCCDLFQFWMFLQQKSPDIEAPDIKIIIE